jgi:lysozyme
MLKRAQYWLDHLDAEMIHEIAKVEGIILEAYYDSVGVLTWSVGITSKSGHNVERYRRNPSTLERALEVYIWLLKTRYGPRVVRAFGDKLITKEQFTAALSFDWNTGGIHRATWVKQFLAGNVSQAKRSIMNWKSPPSIIGRRKHERDLFFGGSFSGVTTMTQYNVNSNLTPRWSSARRIDVSKQVADILNRMRTPQQIVKDAASEDRQSTTKRAVEVGTIGTLAAGAEEQLKPVQNLSERVSEVSGIDVGLVILVIVLLSLAWVYRERIRKVAQGRKAVAMLDLSEEVEPMPVPDLGPRLTGSKEEADALAAQSE